MINNFAIFSGRKQIKIEAYPFNFSGEGVIKNKFNYKHFRRGIFSR